MACPLAPLVLLGAAAGGSHTLFVQDRRYRPAAWGTLATLLLGWGLYASLWRVVPLRVALEALTLAAAAAGILRAVWLARHGGVVSPAWGLLRRTIRAILPVMLDPPALFAQAWFACMLTLQARGLVRFAAAEYAVVLAALLLAVTWRLLRDARARRTARTPFAALESFAGDHACERCPLGFGNAPDAQVRR